MSKFISILKQGSKNAAYCAIFIALAGCAATNSRILNAAADDTLAASRVSERAQAIASSEVATRMEQDAIRRQNAADASVVGIESACMPRFLVNKCINDARNARNAEWDAAQVDLTAARLYLRTAESNQHAAELQQKLREYNAEQAALAPVRAANAAAFAAKTAASAQRQAEYAAQIAAQAPERAANKSAFAQKQLDIEAIKKKRLEDAAKRAAAAAAKNQ